MVFKNCWNLLLTSILKITDIGNPIQPWFSNNRYYDFAFIFINDTVYFDNDFWLIDVDAAL